MNTNVSCPADAVGEELLLWVPTTNSKSRLEMPEIPQATFVKFVSFVFNEFWDIQATLDHLGAGATALPNPMSAPTPAPMRSPRTVSRRGDASHDPLSQIE